MDDPAAEYASEDEYAREVLWTPKERGGFTWVQTAGPFPECWSLFGADGEMVGFVRARHQISCRALFPWGELVYRSPPGEEGGYSHRKGLHFEKLSAALRAWAQRQRDAGADLPILRDALAHSSEADIGHDPMTIEEHRCREAQWGAEADEPPLAIEGWRAERAAGLCCEGYRLRGGDGRLRGFAQVRLGVVRAEAWDAEEEPPGRAFGGGRIVLQERLRPMAGAFENAGERREWLGRAVKAVRAAAPA